MKDINLFKVKDSFYFREVSGKEDALKDLDCDGFLVRSDEKVCRAIIASLKDKKIKKKIAFVGGDDALNRRAVETLGIDYLVSVEGNTLKDTLKQRDSGLNHVVAKLAREKGVGIVVSMNDVVGLKGKDRALRLAKIIQNVKVCRKAGCSLKVASFGRDKNGVFGEKGRRSFGVTLGMSSQEVKSCVEFD